MGHTVRTDHTHTATETVTEAASLIRTAFAAPGGPASAPGMSAMNHARVLLDLAAVQAQAQQADALTRIANVMRNDWDRRSKRN